MVLATVLFTLLLVTFKPLNPGTGPQDGGGDIVNQLGYGSLGALAILCLALFADPRRVLALASPWWGLLLGFFVLSILRAADPGSAARAASFSIIIILALAAALSLPRSFDGLSAMVKTAAAIILVFSFLGLVLMPEAAIHGSGGYEAQHAGFWRGIYSHKNIAGPVMACLAFAGLWLWRRGEKGAGAAIFLAAMVFVLNTGSKTTAGLVPAAMLLVMLPNLMGMRRAVVVAYLVSIATFGLATLGIVYIDALKDLARELAPDLTYTGRTTLWAFGGEMIMKKPWKLSPRSTVAPVASSSVSEANPPPETGVPVSLLSVSLILPLLLLIVRLSELMSALVMLTWVLALPIPSRLAVTMYSPAVTLSNRNVPPVPQLVLPRSQVLKLGFSGLAWAMVTETDERCAGESSGVATLPLTL